MAAPSPTGPFARLVAIIAAWWRAWWTGPAPVVREAPSPGFVTVSPVTSMPEPDGGWALLPDPPKRRRPCRRAAVLAVLREATEPLTAHDLAVLVPTTPGSAPAHLRRLEKRGEAVRVGKAWRATAAEAARRA